MKLFTLILIGMSVNGYALGHSTMGVISGNIGELPLMIMSWIFQTILFLIITSTISISGKLLEGNVKP